MKRYVFQRVRFAGYAYILVFEDGDLAFCWPHCSGLYIQHTDYFLALLLGVEGLEKIQRGEAVIQYLDPKRFIFPAPKAYHRLAVEQSVWQRIKSFFNVTKKGR